MPPVQMAMVNGQAELWLWLGLGLGLWEASMEPRHNLREAHMGMLREAPMDR
jgi:hypothetical protein